MLKIFQHLLLLQSCPTCDLAALSAAGNCMPGSYTLTCSVTNSNGATDSVDRQLIVYQAASYSASLVLFKDLANATAAAEIAAGLTNSSSEHYAAGAAAVLAALPSDVAANMQPTDVVVNGASVLQQAVQGFSVVANVSIYLFVPSGVHKQDLDSFKASVANAAATATIGAGAKLRRLLQQDQSSMCVTAQATSRTTTAAAGSLRFSTVGSTAAGNVGRFLQMLQQHSSSPGECSRSTDSACRHSDAAAADQGQGRRLLQASSNGMDAALSTLNSSLAANLGATGGSSEAITDQNVDLLAVSILLHLYHFVSRKHAMPEVVKPALVMCLLDRHQLLLVAGLQGATHACSSPTAAVAAVAVPSTHRPTCQR
jgi:PKD repeat protein